MWPLCSTDPELFAQGPGSRFTHPGNQVDDRVSAQMETRRGLKAQQALHLVGGLGRAAVIRRACHKGTNGAGPGVGVAGGQKWRPQRCGVSSCGYGVLGTVGGHGRVGGCPNGLAV